MGTEIEMLVVGNCILYKDRQNPILFSIIATPSIPTRHSKEVIVDFLWEFVRFLLKRKKYWLVPVLLVMLLIGGIVVFSQGSVLAPLIYTIF